MRKMYYFIMLVIFVCGQTARAQLFNFVDKSKKGGTEFLIFYSNNCQWCSNADKAMAADADFQQKLLAQYTVRAFDIGTAEGKQAAAKLGVTSVPAFVQFKSDRTRTTINGFNGTKGLGAVLFSSPPSPAPQLVPPPNDECAGAIPLAGVSGTVSGDNSQATNSNIGNPLCQSQWQKDVWYKFTLAAPSFVNIMVNGVTMTDPILILYSGADCNSFFFQIDCNDDGGSALNPAIARNLNAGTYFIRIAGYYLNTGIGTFNLVYNLSTTCANNILDNGEQCDDGNLSGSDGCSPTCTFENQAGTNGVAVNEDGTPPNPSAILDIKSPTKGMLVPRLTTAQRTAIFQPSKGLLVYDITTNSFWYYSTLWSEVKQNKKISFMVILKHGITNLNKDTIPVFDSVAYNDGNDFANNVFTVPEDGLYSLSATANIKEGSATRPVVLFIETPTATINAAATYSSDTRWDVTMVNITQQQLKAGTQIRIRINPEVHLTGLDVSGVKFFGHKIY